MKKITTLKSFTFFCLLSFLFVSCSREEMENAINEMLEPVSLESSADIPEEAQIYINGELAQMPLNAVRKLPQDMIESITITRATSPENPAKVEIQLKEGLSVNSFTTMKVKETRIDTLKAASGSSFGEHLLYLAVGDKDISEYDIYVNDKKMTYTAVKNYKANPSMAYSAKMNPTTKRIEIAFAPKGTPTEEIRNTIPSVKEQIIKDFTADTDGYLFFLNNEKSSLDDLDKIQMKQGNEIIHEINQKIIHVKTK